MYATRFLMVHVRSIIILIIISASIAYDALIQKRDNRERVDFNGACATSFHVRSIINPII